MNLECNLHLGAKFKQNNKKPDKFRFQEFCSSGTDAAAGAAATTAATAAASAAALGFTTFFTVVATMAAAHCH